MIPITVPEWTEKIDELPSSAIDEDPKTHLIGPLKGPLPSAMHRRPGLLRLNDSGWFAAIGNHGGPYSVARDSEAHVTAWGLGLLGADARFAPTTPGDSFGETTPTEPEKGCFGPLQGPLENFAPALRQGLLVWKDEAWQETRDPGQNRVYCISYYSDAYWVAQRAGHVPKEDPSPPEGFVGPFYGRLPESVIQATQKSGTVRVWNANRWLGCVVYGTAHNRCYAIKVGSAAYRAAIECGLVEAEQPPEPKKGCYGPLRGPLKGVGRVSLLLIRPLNTSV